MRVKGVELNVDSSIYNNEYVGLGQTAKTVVSGILKEMEANTNLIQVAGRTMKNLVEHTGYSDATIRNQISTLVNAKILEHTALRGEYIVNPVFAFRGDETMVWKSYAKVESELKEKNNEQK